MLISLVAFAGLVSAKSYSDYVFLFLGDSTSASGTGYVDCINEFLCGSQVINNAKSGYSTQIYLDDTNLQQQVAEEVKLARSRGKTVVCSQQFGNIDEKPDARFMNHSKFVLSSRRCARWQSSQLPSCVAPSLQTEPFFGT